MNLYDPGCPVYKGLVLYEIHGGGGGGGFELFFLVIKLAYSRSL